MGRSPSRTHCCQDRPPGLQDVQDRTTAALGLASVRASQVLKEVERQGRIELGPGSAARGPGVWYGLAGSWHACEGRTLDQLVSELLASTLREEGRASRSRPLEWVTRRPMHARVDLEGQGGAAPGARSTVGFTFDANVLRYASDEASAYQSNARAFLDRVAGGDDLVYLF